MSTRLATKAEEVLALSGIDVVASLTGNARAGSLILSDPSDYSRVVGLLKTSGMRVARRNAAHVDVHLPENAKRRLLDEDSDEGVELDSLISSWRQFAAKSSDNGYRKASRRIATHPGFNPIQAAHQIADATLRISRKSPILSKIARALKLAAKKQDVSSIKRLLSRLAGGPDTPKPILKDPNNFFPLQEESSEDPFRVERPRLGKAEAKNAAVSSATSFLQNYVADQGFSPRDVFLLKMNPGKVFDAWRSQAPEGLPLHVYDDAWTDAVEALYNQMKGESRRSSLTWLGSDSGMDFLMDDGEVNPQNQGFSVVAALDIPYDAKAIKKLVGAIIEYYVVDDKSGEPLHPSEISESQVKNYLKKEAPEAPFKAVMEYLEKVTNRIPNRHEEFQKASKAAGLGEKLSGVLFKMMSKIGQSAEVTFQKGKAAPALVEAKTFVEGHTSGRLTLIAKPTPGSIRETYKLTVAKKNQTSRTTATRAIPAGIRRGKLVSRKQSSSLRGL